jgi:phage gp36-like protein
MAYCSREEVERLVGPENFRQMLDDDLDGAADAGLFEAVAEDASLQADGYLAAQYAVPFSGTVPPFVRQCAKVFACELLYARRGLAREANPWTAQADALRTRLGRIARGEDILDARQPGASDSVEAVTEPSKVSQAGGTLLF